MGGSDYEDLRDPPGSDHLILTGAVNFRPYSLHFPIRTFQHNVYSILSES